MAFSDLWPSVAKWLDPAVTPALQINLVLRAYADIDIGEHPPGSNRSTTIDQYLRDAGVDEGLLESGRGFWCGAALGAWHRASGAQVPPNYADVDEWMTWAKKIGTWVEPAQMGVGNKFAGYTAIFGIPGDASHCGLLTRWDDYKRCIQGNTSSNGYSANGVLVASKDMPTSGVLGYIRPVARA